MGISKAADEDGLIAVETVTRNGVTWAIGIAEGEWRAYPDQNYLINYGMVCAVGYTREHVKSHIPQ